MADASNDTLFHESRLQVLKEMTVKGIRKTIASRLGAIWQEAVHVTLVRECDFTTFYANKGALPHALTDYLLLALVRVLQEEKFAVFNSHYEEQLLRTYSSVNLGLALDHPKGLIVPVIHGAEALDIAQLSVVRKEAAGKALAWKHKPADLEEGTFTVTNLGPLGIDSFTPILNPPQVAILGIGRMKVQQVGWTWGEPTEARALVPLSLTIDHRVLDGADAAKFLQRLEAVFQELVVE